jgi:hypothetical protein
MKTHADREGRQRRRSLFLFHALVFAMLLTPPPAWCQLEGKGAAAPINGEAVSDARAASLRKILEGEWVGGRLLCRKEEDNAVRCGKPVKFSVTFRKDGTGASTDEHFPNAFTYRWKSKSELVLTSDPGGKELTLFQFEIQEGALTFQAYIYLAIKDPDLPREASYIHYIFDVYRID